MIQNEISGLRRKRLTALVLALIICLSGCGDNRNGSPKNASPVASLVSESGESDSISETGTHEINKNKLAIREPIVTENPSLPGGTETVWDCVIFGSYPTAEITRGEFSAVDDYAYDADDVIFDEKLFERLENADWYEDDAELDGERYRRIKYSGANGENSREQHYKWEDTDSWHYFRYEPVKWRVIELDGDIAEIMADRQLDCEPYNENAEDVYWESCTLRSFLNGSGKDSFFGEAFSEDERSAVVKSSCDNPENYYFGTDCGNGTEDYVFIPAEREIFMTDEALRHGFAKSDAISDAARRFRPTMYAMAKGAWYSPVETNKGNGFWFVRTCGYTPSNVNYICDFGAVYNRGTYVTTNDAGVLPVIRIDLNKAHAEYAGTVSSADIFISETADGKAAARDDIPQSDGITKTDIYNEPEVVPDNSLSSGQRTSWECVYFGTYPTCEVVSGEFDAIEEYAVTEGDVITDKKLYDKLAAAVWKDNEVILDGKRYRRLTAADTNMISTDSPQHYKWNSTDSYHYFRYEPIKWRVIECDGENVLLLADRALDCEAYNTANVDADWESCTLRSFLNSYGAKMNGAGTDYSRVGFLNTAFSEEEQTHIVSKEINNPDNTHYLTDCGNSTNDKVFTLSCDDVYSSPVAADHGFYAGSGVDDPAKRFKPTMYAMARGTWYSPVEEYKGNNFWFMRTNGYTLSNVSYICDFGYIYSRGTNVSCNDAGILPAIWVNTEGLELNSAGQVTSG